MSNQAFARPGAPATPIAYFVLKSSQSYRFWRDKGRRMIDLQKGVVHPVSSPEDAAYFRSRGDVVVECDASGKIFGAAAPGAVDPKKAISFKKYGNKTPPTPQKGAPLPPPPVVVGKQAPPVPMGPPIAAPAPVVASSPPPSVPTSSVPAPSSPATPSVPPPPPLDRKSRSAKAQAAISKLQSEQKSEPMSPIELADKTGNIEAKVNVQR